jgi:hypothetical protein
MSALGQKRSLGRVRFAPEVGIQRGIELTSSRKGSDHRDHHIAIRADLAIGRNAGTTRPFHNVQATDQEPVKLYAPVG